MAATTMNAAQLSRQVARLSLRPDVASLSEKRFASIVQQRAHHSVASSSRQIIDGASGRSASGSRAAFGSPLTNLKRSELYGPTHARCLSAMSSGTTTTPSVTIETLKPILPAKKRQRLGRGNSSGRGGTSTRGHKGQKARAGNGKPVPGFAGGQTPIMRAMPKRGFTNIFAKDYASVTLSRLQEYIDRRLLSTSTPVTAHELYKAGVVTDCKDGIKLLGTGAETLTEPVTIVVSKATQLAIAAIEQAGGTVVCKYYTASSLDALVHPERWADRIPPRDPDPTTKKDFLYYSNPENRGYLAGRQPRTRPRESPKYLLAGAKAQLPKSEEKPTQSATATALGTGSDASA